MEAGLRALLTGLIDYAGLFPPARLELEPALRNYVEYQQSAEAWMLSRFICPAARLANLAPLVEELGSNAAPLRLSVIARGGETVEQLLAAWQVDLDDVESAESRLGGRVSVESLEIRLPATSGDGRALIDLITKVDQSWNRDRNDPRPAFYEPHPGANWAEIAPAFEAARRQGANVGLKLRCGGLEPSAFPTLDAVAAAIHAASAADVPIKLTAGLHHPLRHYNESAGCEMHGFVNVFVAGVLAKIWNPTPADLREVLANEDPERFVFDADGLVWKDIRISTRQIADARASFATSFGSCSFDEPRDDLRALGWL